MNKKQIFERFNKLISIESVSTDPKRHQEILKAVEFLKNELNTLGFQVNTFQTNNCPPLIIAKKFISKKARTIGVYAHYDVQPEDPVAQWESPPFKLTLKGRKFFGRGVADDKGHIIQTLTSIKHLIEVEKLSNNIVLIFEGEEEIGSVHFEELIKKAAKDIGKIDFFYLLDFGMKDKNCGKILFGLRGLIGFELTVKTASADLHSGLFGGDADNPVQIIAELLTKIKDNQTGKILIPGFYEEIKKPTEKELLYLKKAVKNKKDLLTKIYPSFDVNGINSGYTKEGIKTIIPATATVKFSFRLIEDQTPEAIEIKVRNFIKTYFQTSARYRVSRFRGTPLQTQRLLKSSKQVSSPQLEYSLKTLAKLMPFHTDIDNPYIKKSAEILKQTFGDVSFSRTGGSVGAAATLKKLFSKPVVMTGFCLDDGNIHSPNENLDEEMFYKGIETLKKLLSV